MNIKPGIFSDVRTGGPSPSGGPGKPDFSDVRTGSSSVATGAAGARTVTVQAGDTLSQIAQTAYGKASRWEAIFQANRDQLDDPDKIRPGQVLKLPE